jgi:drug/metabolite transporter (DMT)-like permease
MAPLFVQGCISSAIPYALIAYGQLSVTSGVAAILNSTTPVFICLISLFWTRHEVLNFNRVLGVSGGLAGVILIARVDSLYGLSSNVLGQAAIIAATASAAVAAIHGRNFKQIPPEVAAAGSLTCGAIVLAPLCFIVEAPLQSVPSTGSIAALLVNALVATALRSVIYFRLLCTVGSMGTTSAGYLKPAIGVLIGCTFLGEDLTWATTVGLIAIFIGVATINRKQWLEGDGRSHSKPARGVGVSGGFCRALAQPARTTIMLFYQCICTREKNSRYRNVEGPGGF